MESWFTYVYVSENHTIRRAELLYPRNWRKQLRKETTRAPAAQSYGSRVGSRQTYLGSHPGSCTNHLTLTFGKFTLSEL